MKRVEEGGGGGPEEIPEEVQAFINEERRLLKLEGSARLDVNEQTSVEGLILRTCTTHFTSIYI